MKASNQQWYVAECEGENTHNLMSKLQTKSNQSENLPPGIINQSTNKNSNFNWIYSSSQIKVTDFNWNTNDNQPLPGSGHCVYVKADSKQWFVAECDDENTRNFICQF